MKTKDELEEVMNRLGFRLDPFTGGYRRQDLWLSETQAREAFRAAENSEEWTEEDVEPLSESLARSLTRAGIH